MKEYRLNKVLTGRTGASKSEPRFQNLPIRSKAGERIRRAIFDLKTAPVLHLDYSSFERKAGEAIMDANIGHVARTCARHGLSWFLMPGGRPVMEIQGYGEITFQPDRPLHVLFRPTNGPHRDQVEKPTMRIIEELKEL